jgi:peptidoglycan/LPS O-acetylase OafA/YrhL
MDLRVLDGLRGLTALYVVVYHACGLLWRGASAGSPSFAWFFENAFSFGHQAVLLFFLISGFCIHYRQAKTGAQRIDNVAFAVRRVRRLYPSLLLALIITTALDHVGMQLNPDYYTDASARWGGSVTVGSSYTLQTVLGNALVQARQAVPELGSNSPLWSMGVEFWLYVLYPLMLRLFVRVGPGRATLAIGVVSAASWILLGWLPWWHLRVLSYWAVWAVGAAIAEAYVRGQCPRLVRRLGPLTPLALIALAAMAPIGSDPDRVPDLWWGAVLGLGLAHLLLAGHRGWLARSLVRCRQLGKISYSLYLVHYPLLALTAAWWLASQGGLPRGLELSMFGLASATAFGWLAWYAVERHTLSASPERGGARSTARVRSRLAQTGRVLACRAIAHQQYFPAGDRLSRHTTRIAPAAGLVSTP